MLDDDPAKSSNASGFMGYDDLVKAKGILDLIVELPSFEEELGETVRHFNRALFPHSILYLPSVTTTSV